MLRINHAPNLLLSLVLFLTVPFFSQTDPALSFLSPCLWILYWRGLGHWQWEAFFTACNADTPVPPVGNLCEYNVTIHLFFIRCRISAFSSCLFRYPESSEIQWLGYKQMNNWLLHSSSICARINHIRGGCTLKKQTKKHDVPLFCAFLKLQQSTNLKSTQLIPAPFKTNCCTEILHCSDFFFFKAFFFHCFLFQPTHFSILAPSWLPAGCRLSSRWASLLQSEGWALLTKHTCSFVRGLVIFRWFFSSEYVWSVPLRSFVSHMWIDMLFSCVTLWLLVLHCTAATAAGNASFLKTFFFF